MNTGKFQDNNLMNELLLSFGNIFHFIIEKKKKIKHNLTSLKQEL